MTNYVCMYIEQSDISQYILGSIKTTSLSSPIIDKANYF